MSKATIKKNLTVEWVDKCRVSGTDVEKAVSVTINELLSRDILDIDAYRNEFGCKSYDEVVNVVRRKTGLK